MARKKVIQRPHCGKSSSEVVEESEFKHAEKMKEYKKSTADIFNKKISE
jgi:hypothetical protein